MATVSAPRPFRSISFWTCAGALWALWAPGAASASGTVSAPGPFRSIGFCTHAGAPWAPWTASAPACLANIASRSASIAAIWPSSNSSRSTFLHQRPVDPEPVEPGFLNDDDRIGFSRPSQNLVADRPKNGPADRPGLPRRPRLEPVLGHPLSAAGDQRSDQPFRTAQFQRDENGANMRLDSGGFFVRVK